MAIDLHFIYVIAMVIFQEGILSIEHDQQKDAQYPL